MLQFFQQNLKGIALSFLIGIGIFFLAPIIGFMNGVMMGLLVGIIIGNLISFPNSFVSGISFSSSRILEFSIVLLAFSINVSDISKLGWQSFVIVLLVIVLVLLATLYLSKKLNCPNSTGVLVGFGTAICGSAAVAAVAPGISKNKEDTGIALAVVNLMGGIGMIALPFLLTFIPLSDIQSGIVIGGSLHSVGNVAGAGFGMDKVIGETALTIKLARVAMLSPAVIFFTYLVNRKDKKTWKESLKLPVYLWAFVLVTIFSSFVSLPSNVLQGISTLGKITLTIAMVAIGLKISFKQLYLSGKRALTFGVIIFLVQLVIIGVLLATMQFL